MSATCWIQTLQTSRFQGSANRCFLPSQGSRRPGTSISLRSVLRSRPNTRSEGRSDADRPTTTRTKRIQESQPRRHRKANGPATSRVENGHTIPSVETLEKIARALEVPLHVLFHDGKSPVEKPVLSRGENGTKRGTCGAAKGMSVGSYCYSRRYLRE